MSRSVSCVRSCWKAALAYLQQGVPEDRRSIRRVFAHHLKIVQLFLDDALPSRRQHPDELPVANMAIGQLFFFPSRQSEQIGKHELL